MTRVVTYVSPVKVLATRIKMESSNRGCVTPIDYIYVTAATAVSQRSNFPNGCSQQSKQLKNTVKVQIPVWNGPTLQHCNLLQTGMDCNNIMWVGLPCNEVRKKHCKSEEAFA